MLLILMQRMGVVTAPGICIAKGPEVFFPRGLTNWALNFFPRGHTTWRSHKALGLWENGRDFGGGKLTLDAYQWLLCSPRAGPQLSPLSSFR